jgi:hypothetical protein
MLVSSKCSPASDAQADARDARLDHRRSSDQDRPREAFVHHRLHRAQHGFFLALGVGHALGVARARSNTGFISMPVRKTNWVSCSR